MSRVPSANWIISFDFENQKEPDLSYPEIKNSAVAIQCMADGSYAQYYLYLEFYHPVEPCFINLPRYGIPDSALARSFYLSEKLAQRHFCNLGCLLDGPHYPKSVWRYRPKIEAQPLSYQQGAVLSQLFRKLLYNFACTKGLRRDLVHCPDCFSLRDIKMFITHRECINCVKGDHYHFHCFNCDCMFYVDTDGEQIRCNYYGVDSVYQYSSDSNQ